ncbi:MAG: type II secretion system minor pseudopilin GspH [Steroidobacteraceae bacterium]
MPQSLARRARGFTLIEILVVVVIIAIVAVGAILSLSVLGHDDQLDTERDRLVDLLNYARDQASLQTRELGLYCTLDGYRFLEFNPLTNLWEDVTADDALRPRQLPDGLHIDLSIESRAVVLKTSADAEKARVTDAQSYKPHVMIFSNGDLTSFALRLERDGTDHQASIAPDSQNRIVAHDVDASAESAG